MTDFPINDGLFNYAAKQLGGQHAKYQWKDSIETGAMGVQDQGEVTYEGKVIKLDQHTPRLGDIDTKALQLAKTHMAFPPTKATAETRVYARPLDTKRIPLDESKVAGIDALANAVLKYLRFPSFSCQEKNAAQLFKQQLQHLGFRVHQDSAHRKISCDGSYTGSKEVKGQTGNVIGVLRGDPKLPSIHLSVHLDRVTPQPLKGPIPTVRNGNILKTDGTSILGADNVAGTVIIVKAIEYIKAAKIPHGDIHVSGLIAEEEGAYGARHMALKDMQGDIGIVIDGYYSEKGVVFGASDIIIWDLEVKSKSPAVHPEAVASRIMTQGWGLTDKSSYQGHADSVIVATSGAVKGSTPRVPLRAHKPDQQVLSWKLTVHGVAEHVSLAAQKGIHNADYVADRIITEVWKVGADRSFRNNTDVSVEITKSERGARYEETLGDGTKVDRARKSNSVPNIAFREGFLATTSPGAAETALKSAQQYCQSQGVRCSVAVRDVTAEPQRLAGHTAIDTAIRHGQLRTERIEPDRGKALQEEMRAKVAEQCRAANVDCSLKLTMGLKGYNDSSLPTMRLTEEAFGYIDAKPRFVKTHGGSNVNFLIGKRRSLLLFPQGVHAMHTQGEWLDLKDMRQSLKLVLGVALGASQYRRVN